MVRIRVEVAGAERLAQAVRGVLRAQEAAAAAAVATSAQELRAELRSRLGRDGGGSSAPGEAPRRVSGRLARSLFVERGLDGLSARVGSALDYAAHLEFGTRRMAARPWLLPSFESCKPRIQQRVAATTRAALRGAREERT